jgi:hypothetical protein
MKLMIGTLMAALVVVGASAQEVNQRKENQQDRIANGVSSGKLTAGETANLEKKETKVNKEIRTDRKANGGNLTNKEKAQVNGQQNKVGKQIAADKHNAKTATYGNNKVGARRQEQQQRIAQGIKSGKMTAKEAAKTETKETKINKQDAADRKANGGNLTNNQKAKINARQNKASTQIYDDKHNAAKQ